MADENLLQEAIKGIPHPLILINDQFNIIYINDGAKNLLNLSSEKEWNVTPGLLLNCQNAINLGNCGTTLLCDKCQLNTAFEHVLENRTTLKNQTGTIYTHSHNSENIWRLKFDCSYINFNMGAVIISLHDALLIPHSKQQANNNLSANLQKKSDQKQKFDTNNQVTSSLLNTEACLNALLKYSNDALLMLDENNNIIKWNSALLILLELKDSIITHELLSKTIEFQLLESGKFVSRNWEHIIKNVSTQKTLEGIFAINQKLEKWVRLDIVPYQGKENNHSGKLIVIKDLSAEKNMRDQAMLHRYALEYFPAEFYYIHTDGRILYANKQARNCLGIDSNQYNHLTITDVNPNINIDWWVDSTKKLENDEALEFETLHKTEDGELYPVLVNIFMPDTNQPNLFCYSSHNLASHKTIEKSLIKESFVNKSLAEISRELTIHNELNSVELLVRQYALQITESDYAFLAYRDPINGELKITIYSDNADNYREEVKIIEHFVAGHFNKNQPITEDQRKISDRIENNSCELIINGTQLKELIPFNRIASVGIFFNNQYKGLLLVAGRSSDYAEDDLEHLESIANLFALAINRIQEKHRLVESMEQLELAINVANMAVWDIYPENDEIIINPGWISRLNIDVKDQKAKLSEVINLLHPEDMPNVIKGYEEHKNSHSPYFEIPCRVKIKNGSYRWLQGTGRIVSRTPDGRIQRIIGLATDNTDQVELNKKLLHSREEAVAANKSKSVFLARMSHEIRTPLNAIIGFADILKKNTHEPVQLDYLNNIKKSGMTLMNLISDILDYSKIEAGKLSLNKNKINIRTLIHETQSLFMPLLNEKKLKFKSSISDNTPELILHDELRLRQILTNLLSNAVKFTETGGIDLIVSAETTKKEKADISIKIIDTGIGIKPESQKNIFEDFTQQEDQDNRRYGGTGLGLGIVKRLLELMGGSIELQSTPEEGSTFTITLTECEIVPKTTLKRVINKQTESADDNTIVNHENSKETINNESKTDCIKKIKPLWDEFSFRPSFGPVSEITTIMRKIATKHNDGILEKIAKRLDNAVATFDVEELNKCIIDFNFYTKIDDYFE